MLRMATSVLLAMSISCNLGYPSAVRADDDWGRSGPICQIGDTDAYQARGGHLRRE